MEMGKPWHWKTLVHILTFSSWVNDCGQICWCGCCSRCFVAQLCLTLCDPMDGSPPGSSVHGISQERILEWVVISSSRGSSWPRDRIRVSCIGRWFFTAEPPGKPHSVIVVQSLSCVRLFETPWTEGCQAPLSMEFSRQEYWSGLPVPSPGDLPDPEIKPGVPALQADYLLSEPAGKLWWCC